jgi:hypothetical protein
MTARIVDSTLKMELKIASGALAFRISTHDAEGIRVTMKFCANPH